MSENLIGVTEILVAGVKRLYIPEDWEEDEEEVREPIVFVTKAYIPSDWFGKGEMVTRVVDYFRLDTTKGFNVTDLTSGECYTWNGLEQ